MSDLLTALAGFGPFPVLVVGDFMLDELVHGDASRLSPDAPVPVLTVDRIERAAGGASNVAACLAGLGGLVRCCGVIGGDGSGSHLRGALEAAGCETSDLVEDADRPTTVKRNLVGLAQHRHPQKMFRLDIESSAPIAASTAAAIEARVRGAIAEVAAVCIEDYGKGVCTPALCSLVIETAREAGVPVLVDPANRDCYARYAGATVMTPNRTEAARVCASLPGSPDDPADMARALLERCELDAIIITLDRHGALLLERGGEPVEVPTRQRNVYDVTGAGDMVLAAVAAARAHGVSWPDAVVLANAAAGLEVEQFGAHAIPLAVVTQEVLRAEVPQDGKVRTRRDLELELAAHREAGHRIVLTNGCFDVIHAGHVSYLRDAGNQGDVLVVGVNCDEQVAAMKGDGRPVYELADRMAILSELQCVDYVVPFDEPTAHDLIETLRPDLYVKGGDYEPEQINEYEFVRKLGISCRVLAHRPGLGSTDIVNRVKRG
ncbi:MAG: PfkB family carbohydrate kinase [Phycisphaerales bacterium]|jgi:D-beta-D-heptose 7-phosphate kinase/D-beta-D-heptose 1-phosphate adenosyltransferase|nr:PfkB family carbohydrate kinase [Phycisphaerales bacterium]